ncbi:MAG TPA: phosphoribosylaminoimidazolesuccinocarboxamide synthase [Acidobacteriota bacterium]|nr:phosphoribosylaminoimidazolesuccinocarboxamide synthase [Acidobacteriota bacterium]
MKTIAIPELKKVAQGKVREIFEVEDRLLLVATDRLSAFDVVLPDTIPHKGAVLNQISAFWFEKTGNTVPNHLVSCDFDDFPEVLRPYRSRLQGRSMLVRRCRPLPIECVVRGYLAGSGWKEYRQKGSISGIPLPSGLREADKLPQPIFTPSTKAARGHDENISQARAQELVGEELANKARDISLRLYQEGSLYARRKGIIICDTKFEFGLEGDRLILIDEALTPDSSRFWPAGKYRPGGSQPSFDKQFVRDYLETLDWNKQAPGPKLPEEVIEATSRRYLEAFRILTGRELEG